MNLTVDEARVKVEREEFERLSEQLRTYLTENMKRGTYYTPVGLHDLASKFLKEEGIEPTVDDVRLLLVYSDPILERTITLEGTKSI